MKYLLVLAAAIVAANAAGSWDEGLSVRFGISLFVGRDVFITVPQTLSAAKNSRWVESTRPPGQPRASLVLYTPSINDVVLGAFFDNEENVAGLQIALPQDVYSDPLYDWEGQGFIQWNAPANSSGLVRTYWTTAVYFVSEATLAKSPEERAVTRRGRVLQDDNIYVTSFNGGLMPISVVADQVTNTASSGFTEQACIPLMGRHYYYNMSSTTQCTTQTMLTWFPLVDTSADANQLIGLGFMTFGRLPASALIKDYFERPSESAVRMIVNNGPECLYNTSGQNGVVTMHIYFVNSPLLINCF